jgi:hypothetical protein
MPRGIVAGARRYAARGVELRARLRAIKGKQSAAPPRTAPYAGAPPDLESGREATEGHPPAPDPGALELRPLHAADRPRGGSNLGQPPAGRRLRAHSASRVRPRHQHDRGAPSHRGGPDERLLGRPIRRPPPPIGPRLALRAKVRWRPAIRNRPRRRAHDVHISLGAGGGLGACRAIPRQRSAGRIGPAGIRLHAREGALRRSYGGVGLEGLPGSKLGRSGRVQAMEPGSGDDRGRGGLFASIRGVSHGKSQFQRPQLRGALAERPHARRRVHPDGKPRASHRPSRLLELVSGRGLRISSQRRPGGREPDSRPAGGARPHDGRRVRTGSGGGRVRRGARGDRLDLHLRAAQKRNPPPAACAPLAPGRALGGGNRPR